MEPALTTSNGAPIGDVSHSLVAGSVGGPTLLQDFVLIDRLAHFDREVIPERRVHARGAGAHGYFEVTKDVSKYCKADFLSSVGKKTPIFTRFSTVTGERGRSDQERDPRGFAIKFYTEEGNYDLVGLNLPVFSIRDAMKFPDLIHSHKLHPQTNLPDIDAAWDFWSLSPESTHHVIMLYTDRGTPDGYRKMDGFGLHTFKWVSANGDQVWIKWHWKPAEGVHSLSHQEALDKDPDYATRDLFEHIASGKEVEWRMYVQIMPYLDAFLTSYDPFDVTKIWPHKDYPLHEVGRLVLNKNVDNYHDEVEQSAFSPSHLVPGIEASPDPVLQGRLFSYPDTQRHRLGSNFQQLPINCPFMTKVANYQRGGVSFKNHGDGPNYYPNSLHGPVPPRDLQSEQPFQLKDTEVARHAPSRPIDDFSQATALYKKVLTPKERDALVNNLVADLKPISRDEIKRRAILNFAQVDKDLGKRVASRLNIDMSGKTEAWL